MQISKFIADSLIVLQVLMAHPIAIERSNCRSRRANLDRIMHPRQTTTSNGGMHEPHQDRPVETVRIDM